MLGRPYRVGSLVRLRGPNLGAFEYEGTISDMGALYTTLTTAAGAVLKLPNSAVVTSALVLGGGSGERLTRWRRSRRQDT